MFHDIRIGLFHIASGKVGNFLCKATIFVYWTDQLAVFTDNAMLQAYTVILLTKARRLVYNPSTILRRHIPVTDNFKRDML